MGQEQMNSGKKETSKAGGWASRLKDCSVLTTAERLEKVTKDRERKRGEDMLNSFNKMTKK